MITDGPLRLPTDGSGAADEPDAPGSDSPGGSRPWTYEPSPVVELAGIRNRLDSSDEALRLLLEQRLASHIGTVIPSADTPDRPPLEQTGDASAPAAWETPHEAVSVGIDEPETRPPPTASRRYGTLSIGLIIGGAVLILAALIISW